MAIARRYIMENIGINNMMKELKALNPAVKFDVHDYSVSPIIIIFGTAPATELSFPEGYYWNEKNGITDKHNTNGGLYECFTYKYDPSHFQSHPVQRASKKSFFARLFG